MHYAPETNAQRAENGDELLDVYISQAAHIGDAFADGDRAEIGRTMAVTYNGGPISPETVNTVIGDLIADMYHGADPILSPDSLLEVALAELTQDTNMTSALRAMGEEGRPGLYVNALAAVLAYAALAGASTTNVTDMAYMHWSAEAEEARVMQIRAERHGQA